MASARVANAHAHAMTRSAGAAAVADRFTPEVRSRVMSSVRGKDTGPEMAIRRLLHAAGYRYRLHPRTVPGQPDLAFMTKKVAIFIDGCFWHGCPRHYSQPASNVSFWNRKLQSNVNRRAKVLQELRKQGWRAIQIWECRLARNPLAVLERIRRVMARR